MAEEAKQYPSFRFTLEEFSGAFGDSVTVIPLLIGIGISTEANLAHLLLFFGIFQIAAGLFYKLPMPIEPMKALAALAIAGTLTYEQVAAAGIVLGLLLLLTGFGGIMNKLDQMVPRSVVRGVQLGLALLLLRAAVGYVAEGLWLALIGIGIVLLFLFLKEKHSIPNLSAFIVLALGAGFGVYVNGPPEISLISLPQLTIPELSNFPRAIIVGALPQYFLSVGNAILATSLLFKDLFRQKVDPDRLSQSMGVICLISSVFGGFPTCHGSGGLSGQYQFGARTGGSNLILGTIYLGIAIIAGSAGFLTFFPISVLGALLVFVAFELASAGAKTDQWSVTLTVGVVSFFTNIAIGFAVGFSLAKIIQHLNR